MRVRAPRLGAALVALGLALGRATAQDSPPGPPLGWPPQPDWQGALMIRVGETANWQGVREGTLRLHLDEVADDSRCPPGMQRYWPGMATLRLTLLAARESAFELKIAGFDGLLAEPDD